MPPPDRRLRLFFRVLEKERLPDLVRGLAREYEVVGPVAKDDRFIFAPVDDAAELRLDYDVTLLPPKRWFLPTEEPLMRFRVSDNAVLSSDIHAPPRVLFGLHACDINGLLLMDNVFLEDGHSDPYYKARRENTLIVGISCSPSDSCFCNAWHTDEAHWGYDLFLTDLGDDYFVSCRSVKGAEVLDRFVETREVDSSDVARFEEAVARFKSSFGDEIDTSQLPLLLDAKFDSPIWDELGSRCLSCGACSMVCPTCYCFDHKDVLDADHQHGTRVRFWDSCQFRDFATVAQGHRFRGTRASRIKYRYYHKQWGYLSKFERVLCVGCGRCTRACKAHISPVLVIEALRNDVVGPAVPRNAAVGPAVPDEATR
jgi:sulfhydrogenase subunit beta (sulfur reductase)